MHTPRRWIKYREIFMTNRFADYSVGDTVIVVQKYHGTDELKLNTDYKVRALYGNTVWLEPNKDNPVKTTAYIADKFLKKPVKPTIKTQPSSTTVSAGDTLTLSAEAEGGGFMSWKWKKGSTDIKGSEGEGLTATFTKPNVQSADAGSYTCVFTNRAGTTSTSAATVTVN